MNLPSRLNRVKEAVPNLLKLARDSCYNTISDNCSYIVSEIPEYSKRKTLKQQKKINDAKTPGCIDDALNELSKIYYDIYDINLFVYKSTGKRTIVEIAYFLKINTGHELDAKLMEMEPMVHVKVAIPVYSSCGCSGRKFDVNWQRGTMSHRFRMFIWKLKSSLFEDCTYRRHLRNRSDRFTG